MTMNAYQVAEEKANEIDAKIREAISQRRHFLVEAGAGSGKTTSLVKTITWVEQTQKASIQRRGKKVAVITYTNAAVNAIVARLGPDSFVVPSTIHSFCWNLLSQFQSFLISHIKDAIESKKEDYSACAVEQVTYDIFGYRHYDEQKKTLSIHHNDVLSFFCLALDNAKFRSILTSRYPMIFIDEYQDSDKGIINRFLKYFVEDGSSKGPLFGFFGDAWQTIYGNNGAIGEISSKALSRLHKSSNFRSKHAIVTMLNTLRPDNDQISAYDDNEDKGRIIFVKCKGGTDRYKDTWRKGDLLPSALKTVVENVANAVKKQYGSEPKVLQLTHASIADSLGYERVAKLLGDGFKNETDEFLLFFREVIEPVYSALCDKDYSRLADALVSRGPIITKRSDKQRWQDIEQGLEKARKGTVRDVLSFCCEQPIGTIVPNEDILYLLDEWRKDPGAKNGEYSIGDLLEVHYQEFVEAIGFLSGSTIFATEHSVKGLEFDSVLFVINKAWNLYQYEKYAPFDKSIALMEEDKARSYIRNRNLFYVCASRPKSTLIFLLTYDGGPDFDAYLEKLSNSNCIDYDELLSANAE